MSGPSGGVKILVGPRPPPSNLTGIPARAYDSDAMRGSRGAKGVMAMVLITGILAVPAGADSRAAKVEAVFARFASDRAPGAAVLVVENGREVFRRGRCGPSTRSRASGWPR